MSVNKVDLKSTSPLVRSDKTLPKDLETSIGKIRSIIVDIFAKIKAFFILLFFGPWKEFSKNLQIKSLEIASKEKLKIYLNQKNKALEAHKRAFMELTGYEVSSKEDIEKLKKYNKDFKVYQLFEATISEKDYKKVIELLRELEKGNNPNLYPVIVSLKALLKDKNIPKELKDLISEKLKQLSLTDKGLVYIPENPEISSYSTWKKVALGIFGIVAISALGYVIYASSEEKTVLDHCYCENDKKSFGPFKYDSRDFHEIFDRITKPFKCYCTNNKGEKVEVKTDVSKSGSRWDFWSGWVKRNRDDGYEAGS